MTSNDDFLPAEPTGTALPAAANMAVKFGVMGSASREQPEECARKARQLGAAIAAEGGITVTGGSPGLPLAAAEGAISAGGLAIAQLIGVLNGTGGITSVIPDMLAACNKKTGARVLYDDDPKALIAELLLESPIPHSALGMLRR